jgi:monoterpene epsilon-lactone hydrolase
MPSPELRELMDMLLAQRAREAGSPAPPIAESRAVADSAADVYPLPGDVVVTEVSAGGVPACWLDSPDVDPGKVLLYLHGGGYQTGSVRSHRELAARLGREAGARVLLLGYRLAPEHRYPAAIDDALAAWRWLRTDVGLPASSMVIAGDSAGGGLSAALMVAVRDAEEAPAAGAALLSPWTDLACTGPSITERSDQDPIIAAGRLEEMAATYLGGADPRSPLASPLYADLSRLPPLLIQVGTAEMLLSDSLRFAEAAEAAGVEVELHVEEGLPHVFPLMANAPEAHAASTLIGRFLRARLG